MNDQVGCAGAEGLPPPILIGDDSEPTAAENHAGAPASGAFLAYVARLEALATVSGPETPSVDEVAAMRERRRRAGTWKYPPPDKDMRHE